MRGDGKEFPRAKRRPHAGGPRKVRACSIDQNVRREIKRVMDWAFAHPLSTMDVLRTVSKSRPPIGDSFEHTCVIPIGYKVAFSLEMQPSGIHRHISISLINNPGKLPGVAAVQMICEEFGFQGMVADMARIPDKSDAYVWEEMTGPKTAAINVLQKVRALDEVLPSAAEAVQDVPPGP